MNYKHEVQLSASPEAVFKALTTSEGIAGWWTKSNKLRSEKGEELLSLDFGKIKKLMKVHKMDSQLELIWYVLECTLHEWLGTQIAFNIAPNSAGGTLLKLEHKGLNPQLDCYESCSSGWVYFMDSLKKYVETGKGTPY